MSLNRIACERIIRIVRDLRNFARLDEAEFKMANLNEDIETTLSLVRHELKDRIHVVKQFSELPLVPCYPNRLNQVFMNLLINAYQSIPGKGEIRISTALIDHEVKIAISDTGTGIQEGTSGQDLRSGLHHQRCWRWDRLGVVNLGPDHPGSQGQDQRGERGR